MAHRSDGAVLRPAGNRADGRDVGPAIDRLISPRATPGQANAIVHPAVVAPAASLAGSSFVAAPNFRAVRPLRVTPSVVLSGTRPALSPHLRENFECRGHQEYSDRMSCRVPTLPTHSPHQPIYSGRPGRFRCRRRRSLFEHVRVTLLSIVRYFSVTTPVLRRDIAAFDPSLD